MSDKKYSSEFLKNIHPSHINNLNHSINVILDLDNKKDEVASTRSSIVKLFCTAEYGFRGLMDQLVDDHKNGSKIFDGEIHNIAEEIHIIMKRVQNILNDVGDILKKDTLK